MMRTLLGIDGGGTRTRAVLVDTSGSTIHRAEAGPSNLNHSDWETVCASLRSIVERCTENLDEPPLAACVGLAGASAQNTRGALMEIFKDLLPIPTDLTSDAEIALDGAFIGEDGILLNAGTGSICIGRSSNGVLVRSGGWGSLVDDAGSASWIGRSAITQSLREKDGRSPPSALSPTIFKALGLEESSQIIDRIYRPPLSPAEFGQLAPIVSRLAESGESSANAIIEAAVDELEQLARAAAAQLPKSAHCICLSGGLLAGKTLISKHLADRLEDMEIKLGVLPPLSGAIIRAAKMAEVAVDQSFIVRLSKGEHH